MSSRRPDDTFTLKERLNSRKVGGALLLSAAVVAFVLANSPAAPFYDWLKSLYLGFNVSVGEDASVGVRMSIEHWAADGVLAIFFFVVGIELKREFVTGSLRDPRKATLPIAAAVGGMAVPALVYVAVIVSFGASAVNGWAIPVATDIAFALALLAVFGRGLPSTFRTFLLTLAVIDDLLAIIIIAVFFTAELSLLWLLGSLVAIVVFWIVLHRGYNQAWLTFPLAIIAWYCMYQAGVHATIAGVLLGMSVPAKPVGNDKISMAEDMEHDWNAISQGFALPVFALFAAGVPLSAGGSFLDSITDPVFIGVFLGLFIGKPLGVLLVVVLLRRLPAFKLDPSLQLSDVLAMGPLAGIGFTVSLLIGTLAFGDDIVHIDVAHLGVLLGSVSAAIAGIFLLRWRARFHRSSDLAEGVERLP
ncbi:Na+/H+ antiporter NhaA [Pseudoclavibacter endophyticus]|uniref:Na(+)/H(+) antiporter NhaA n=2 Tax=Pseudoclavibacter endophyticus TaxID=1778590 RepID=A0A6H9WS38_9MICO|nr:Na+/H+ antiporter NhaA [Pseudoclavibacter endophyticus]